MYRSVWFFGKSQKSTISIYVRQKYKSNSNRNSIDFNEKEGVPPPAVLFCETAGLIDINELNSVVKQGVNEQCKQAKNINSKFAYHWI